MILRNGKKYWKKLLTKLKTKNMETGVYQITLNDGRIFRIFIHNSTQSRKVIQSYYKLRDAGKVKSFDTITNGIHTTKQFEQILKTI
jgi:hypothetical protein